MSAHSSMETLECVPRENIYFSGPFNEPSTASIMLKNITMKSMLFKIKTTEPKRYGVRPNLGIIEPQQSTCVTVILQPSDDKILNCQGHHKFQILFIPLDDAKCQKPVEEIWQSVKPDGVSFHKLRCFFKLSGDNSTDKTSDGSVATTHDAHGKIDELQRTIEDLKKQNSILSTTVKETQKRLDLALKPSQFPDLLTYTVIGFLGWLFAKLVL